MSTALDNSILTLVTFIPLAGALLLLLFPHCCARAGGTGFA